ncbi:rhodanese-like domain-containing protein [Pseudoalteromonas xiamenensis]|uniref:rhodanese-like domain-containing protein n=1 Tax=Pseudoalteromonas xiamenensis TaxID=882626 RepID=UPI0027E55CE5|nr:rhodanese-like domain-containing protein [Pseudoalteromonas xiamenensis]WMN58884.1 rhodanese-like domain-containing protein [Pseudoalteromonas xiamenensis]
MLKPIQDILQTVKPSLRCITANEAKEEIITNGGLLVDVREPEEHQTRAAKGSINVPRGLLEFKLPAIEADCHRPIYVHCAAGGRAVLAAEQLERIGYQRVTVIGCKADEICDVF